MNTGTAVLSVGVIIMLFGFTMPATQTIYGESCTQGGWVGDFYFEGQCYYSETTVANPDRAGTLGFGIILVIVGGVVALVQNDPDAKPEELSREEDEKEEMTSK